MSPPIGFIDLPTAFISADGSFVNIMGIVNDLMPATITRTGQYMLTFKILDQRLNDSLHGSGGLKVRFFKHDLQSMPKVRQPGDVVLLRNVKIANFQQQPLALANWQTEVTVFPSAAIPDPGYQIAYQGNQRLECLGLPMDVKKLSLQEQNYVVQLKQDMGSMIESIPAPRVPAGRAAPVSDAPAEPAAIRKRAGDDLPQREAKAARTSSFGPKFRLISECRHYDFADLCAQVVKKFPNHYGNCDLYVTDYTENQDMFYYHPPGEDAAQERAGDPHGYINAQRREFPGPYGWLVLKVNLKDPHANYANREVKEGDFVLLKNVKLKAMNQMGAKLEGDMWPDTRNPEKVQVVKMKHRDYAEVQAVLARKEKYWNARKAKDQRGDTKKLSKAEKKKLKKARERDQSKNEKTAAMTKHSRQLANGDSNLDTTDHAQPACNKNVRCSHEEIPTTSIAAIVDPNDQRRHTNTLSNNQSYILPFTNAKYRTRARVIGFFPKHLEDFAIPLDDNDDNNVNSPTQTSLPKSSDEPSTKYIWSFSLLLCTPTPTTTATTTTSSSSSDEKIWVTLHHSAAQFLFGNDMPDPTDLHQNPMLVGKLREKLWTLWGNLEEVERDGEGEVVGGSLSNLSFECCLVEYGVEVDEGDEDGERDRAQGEEGGVVRVKGWKKKFGMFGVTIV